MKFQTFLTSIAFFLLFSGIGLCDQTCRDGMPIFMGEFSPECMKYITFDYSENSKGRPALKLKPDTWHSPVLKLHCGPGTRKDFSPFSHLEFYFRSPEQNPGDPTIQLRTWNQKSKVALIRDYIEGRVIDNTYRSVTIPLSEFMTDDWDLGNVEAIEWNLDSKKRIYYVDKIKLNQKAAPKIIIGGDWGPFAENNKVIRLSFTGRLREMSLRDVKRYTISSPDDRAYRNPLNPLAVGLHYRVYGFSPSKSPYTRYSVFIELPQRMKNDHTYILRVTGLIDEFCNETSATDITLNYNDEILKTPNIKINQEGYLPEAPKIGYVGGYVGDLGGGAWAAGRGGSIYRWSLGHGWERVDSPTNKDLRSIAGFREDNVWFVGNNGEIIKWNGTQFVKLDSQTTEDLHSIAFGPQGTGWVVGKNGLILQQNGDFWQKTASEVRENLNSIWVGNNNSAWAVGDNGVILKWNGSKWLKEQHITSSNLNCVAGKPDSDELWAVGNNGTVITRIHGKWKEFPIITSSGENLTCVVVDPSGAVWIGSDRGVMRYKAVPSQDFEKLENLCDRILYGMTRQNGRRLWAVGARGLLISYAPEGENWLLEKDLGPEDLLTVFSIPYGALRLPELTPQVTIRNISTGQISLKTQLKLEASNWHLSGEDVYSFDFSSIKSSGFYEAYVPGIGVSWPIRISDKALDKAAYATAHAFYYQRCGTPLVEPHAEKDFTRPIDHEYDTNGRKIDAAFYESLPKSLLFNGERPGEMIDAQGGWHDAGDYGKYMPTAAAALWYLFTAYDIQPSNFQDGTWNIPESGNGIPDLLDEAKWELDWITRIQAEDGGIYHKLTSEVWFHGMPQDESSPRQIFDKTTHDTASAAAVLASASRIWKNFDLKLSQNYLDRAHRAWSFLEKHPQAIPEGGFRNPPKNTTGEYRDRIDLDNRLWAAAELYRATGEKKYKDFFDSWWSENKSHPWGWNNWQDFYRCAYWAYLNSDWADTKRTIKDAIKKALLDKARTIMEFTRSNPYRNGARLNVPQWIGWGTFTQSSEYSFVLLLAWSVTGEKRYYDMALLNLDAQLGANPLSMCFITGLGYRSPKDPLHLPSIHDGVDRPIPGLPVFGPVAHLPNNQPYNIASQQDSTSHPQSRDIMDPYPILRRYIDANQLVGMSEFTIVDMAVCAATLNILAEKPQNN